MDHWLTDRGVTLIGGDLDESPMAYRRLPEVIAEHAGTVRVLHTLRPFAVAMAGAGGVRSVQGLRIVDPAAAGRTSVQRRENAHRSPLDDAAFASSGADRFFDRQGIAESFMESPAGGLLYRWQIPEIREPLTA